mmetsp:Transcript_24245/g.77395  ORF Transcript_24245/g.77395 Transcript_24245/m.77395 type:complete len:433 (-) Transcript_24245:1371-2669(-)
MDEVREKLRHVDGAEGHVLAISKIALDLPASEHVELAKAWFAEVREDPDRFVELLYVANDIVQKARLKHIKGLAEEFAKVLPEAMEQLQNEEKRSKVLRVLGLWQERGVYSKAAVRALKKRLGKSTSNPLIGSLSDEEDDDAQIAMAGAVNFDDEEDEFEYGPGEGEGRLRRQDSTVSLHEIPLPRLLVVTKGKGGHAKALSDNAEERLKTSLGGLESKLGKDGTLEKDCLASLSDEEIDNLLAKLRLIIADSKRASVEFKEARILEEGLLVALEHQIDLSGTKADLFRSRAEDCTQFEERLQRLWDAHSTSEAIETVLETRTRVRKQSVQRKRRRAGSSSSASESEEESDEDEEDDGGESGMEEGGKDGDLAKPESIFALNKRHRRKSSKKKKKKKADGAADSGETPMMYNKLLKMYVPVPRTDLEDWRDN